jgi:hypothetical protein
VLDVPAAAILLLGVFVECSGPIPQVHLFGLLLSIPSAAALAFLAVVVLAIRHRALPEHPALARIFRRFGDPEATGEARLFGPPDEPSWRKAAEIGIVGVGFSALVAIVTWRQVARLDDRSTDRLRAGRLVLPAEIDDAVNSLARQPGEIGPLHLFEYVLQFVSDCLNIPRRLT